MPLLIDTPTPMPHYVSWGHLPKNTCTWILVWGSSLQNTYLDTQCHLIVFLPLFRMIQWHCEALGDWGGGHSSDPESTATNVTCFSQHGLGSMSKAVLSLGSSLPSKGLEAAGWPAHLKFCFCSGPGFQKASVSEGANSLLWLSFSKSWRGGFLPLHSSTLGAPPSPYLLSTQLKWAKTRAHQTFSVKGKIVNISDLVGHTVCDNYLALLL